MDEDSPHRLTAHANLLKAALEVQKPRASSGARTVREGTSAEDIATSIEGLHKEKPHRENSAPREIPTPIMKRHKTGHNMYRRKPKHNKAQHIKKEQKLTTLPLPKII
jgi:hypothetical protein